jgi:hypothetical protein
MPLDQQFIFRDHLLIARVDQVIERLVRACCHAAISSKCFHPAMRN